MLSPPVHRLEVFTGAGRRRSFSDEDKARIVAEIATSGESLCAVARRHGLSPQQLFGWRRRLRESQVGSSEADGLQFVPAVVDVTSSASPARRQGNLPACKAELGAGAIEIEIDGVMIRVGRGADATRDRPDGRRPRDGGNQACRLSQRSGRTVSAGARDHDGRPILRRGLCVPGQACGPDQVDLLGWHGSVPV